jgi:hypothetical protein
MDNLPIRLLENLQILIEQGATTGMLSRAIADAIQQLKVQLPGGVDLASNSFVCSVSRVEPK